MNEEKQREGKREREREVHMERERCELSEMRAVEE